MKHKADMDGNKQVSFLDAPTIDVSHLSSRKALEFKQLQLVKIYEAGNADYAREIHQLDKYRKIAAMVHYKWAFLEGERISVLQCKALVKFLDTWEQRSHAILWEIRDLARKLEELPE